MSDALKFNREDYGFKPLEAAADKPIEKPKATAKPRKKPAAVKTTEKFNREDYGFTAPKSKIYKQKDEPSTTLTLDEFKELPKKTREKASEQLTPPDLAGAKKEFDTEQAREKVQAITPYSPKQEWQRNFMAEEMGVEPQYIDQVMADLNIVTPEEAQNIKDVGAGMEKQKKVEARRARRQEFAHAEAQAAEQGASVLDQLYPGFSPVFEANQAKIEGVTLEDFQGEDAVDYKLAVFSELSHDPDYAQASEDVKRQIHEDYFISRIAGPEFMELPKLEQERILDRFHENQMQGGEFDLGAIVDTALKLPGMAGRGAVTTGIDVYHQAEKLKSPFAREQDIYRAGLEGDTERIEELKAGGGVFLSDKMEGFQWLAAEYERQNEQTMEEIIREHGDAMLVPGLLSVRNLGEAGQSLGFSGATMGATVLGTLMGGPVGGGAASFAAAYAADTGQFTRQILQAHDEEKFEKTGEHLTKEEQAALKKEFAQAIDDHGFHEALWETVGNLTTLGAGKVVAKMGVDVLAKSGGKMAIAKAGGAIAGSQAVEMGGETLTQIGQSQAEASVFGGQGLDWNAEGTWEAFKQVAPQTFLVTALMGGGATVGSYSTQRLVRDPRSIRAVKQAAAEIKILDSQGAVLPPEIMEAQVSAARTLSKRKPKDAELAAAAEDLATIHYKQNPDELAARIERLEKRKGPGVKNSLEFYKDVEIRLKQDAVMKAREVVSSQQPVVREEAAAPAKGTETVPPSEAETEPIQSAAVALEKIKKDYESGKADKEDVMRLVDHPKAAQLGLTREALEKIVSSQKPVVKGKEKAEVHDFSSTQVNLPAAAAKKIMDFGRKIPESEIYTDPKDPSLGREDEPHITVKYGLHTNEEAQVREALKDVAPFKAVMGETSIFESDDFDVVKVDINSPELHKINKVIADSLDVTDTHPDYVPHATVAYVKKGRGKKYAGDKAMEGTEIDFDSIMFSNKKGEDIEIKLGGAPAAPKAKPKKKKAAKPAKTGDPVVDAAAAEGIKPDGFMTKAVVDRVKALGGIEAVLEEFPDIDDKLSRFARRLGKKLYVDKPVVKGEETRPPSEEESEAAQPPQPPGQGREAEIHAPVEATAVAPPAEAEARIEPAAVAPPAPVQVAEDAGAPAKVTETVPPSEAEAEVVQPLFRETRINRSKGIAQKEYLKVQIKKGLQSGEIPSGSAIHMTDLGYLKSLIIKGSLPMGKSFEGTPGIYATKLKLGGLEEPNAYGDHNQNIVAIEIPSDWILKETGRPNEVLIKDGAPLGEMKFRLDSQPGTFGIAELKDAMDQVRKESKVATAFNDARLDELKESDSPEIQNILRAMDASAKAFQKLRNKAVKANIDLGRFDPTGHVAEAVLAYNEAIEEGVDILEILSDKKLAKEAEDVARHLYESKETPEKAGEFLEQVVRFTELTIDEAIKRPESLDRITSSYIIRAALKFAAPASVGAAATVATAGVQDDDRDKEKDDAGQVSLGQADTGVDTQGERREPGGRAGPESAGGSRVAEPPEPGRGPVPGEAPGLGPEKSSPPAVGLRDREGPLREGTPGVAPPSGLSYNEFIKNIDTETLTYAQVQDSWDNYAEREMEMAERARDDELAREMKQERKRAYQVFKNIDLASYDQDAIIPIANFVGQSPLTVYYWRKFLKGQGGGTMWNMTDDVKSYSVDDRVTDDLYGRQKIIYDYLKASEVPFSKGRDVAGFKPQQPDLFGDTDAQQGTLFEVGEKKPEPVEEELPGAEPSLPGQKKLFKVAPPKPPSEAEVAATQLPGWAGTLQTHVVGRLKRFKDFPAVTVVKTAGDLPARIRPAAAKAETRGEKVRGVFLPDDKLPMIYLVAENLGTKQLADTTLIHELIGHYHVRGALEMMNVPADKFMRNMYLANPKAPLSRGEAPLTMRAKTIEMGYDPRTISAEDSRKVAEEWLATQIEAGNMERKGVRGWWNRLVRLVRQALRKLNPKLTLTKAEIEDLVTSAWKRASVTLDPTSARTREEAAGAGVTPARFATAPDDWFDKIVEDVLGPEAVDHTAERTVTSEKTGEVRDDDYKSKLFERREASKPPTVFEGFALPSETTIQWLRRKIQDKFIRVKVLQKAIEEVAGTELTESMDTYLGEELYYGRTEDALREFEETHVDPLVEKMQKAELSLEGEAGFESIVRDLLGIEGSVSKINIVEVYLYARHAPERNARIQSINFKFVEEGIPGSGMSDADADYVLKAMDRLGLTRELNEIAELVYEINRERVNLLRESGLEADPVLNLWNATYQYYVSLRGFDDFDPAIMSVRPGLGFDIRGPESERALGRMRPAQDIMTSVISQMEETIIRSQKNEVGKKLLKTVREFPNETLWTVDKVVYVPHFSEREQLVYYGPDPKYKMTDKVLSVKENGQEYYITLEDELLAIAMKNLGVERSDVLTRSLASANRYFALINTSLNPEFVISNFSRDIQEAMIHLGGEQSAMIAGHVARDVGPAIRGVYRVVRGKEKKNEWHDYYKEFRKAGAKISFFGLDTIENKRKKLLKRIQEAEGGPHALARDIFRQTGGLIMDINEAVENGARLSAYVNLRRGGMSQAKAASIAKNLTVNFNRKGDLSQFANSLYLFFNAGVQGTTRMFTAMKSPRVRKIVGGITVSAFMLAELNRLIGGDDEEDGENWYDKVEPWVKEHNLIIMTGDGKGGFIKIPLPYGYSLFNAMGTSMSDLLHGKKPTEVAGHLISTALSSFNPLGGEESKGLINAALKMLSPTISDPLVQWAINENFFGGPIRKEQPVFGLPKPESELHFRSVSPSSKAITERLNRWTGGSQIKPGAIDINPEIIDHFVNSYAGGAAAAFYKRSFDLVVNAATGGPIAPKDIPFVRRVYGSPNAYQSAEKYRKSLIDVRWTAAEFELIEDDNKRQQYLIKNKNKLHLWYTPAQIENIIDGEEPGNISQNDEQPLLRMAEKDLKVRRDGIKQTRDLELSARDEHREVRAQQEEISSVHKRVIRVFNRIEQGQRVNVLAEKRKLYPPADEFFSTSGKPYKTRSGTMNRRKALKERGVITEPARVDGGWTLQVTKREK